MTKTKVQLPAAASEYISSHYPGAVIESITLKAGQNERPGHEVVINHDQAVTHLLFNSEGKLVHQSESPIYPEDYFEGDFYASEE